MKTIQVSSLINSDNAFTQLGDYVIINCEPATGIIYETNNFISGHVRMRGKDNGRYPYNYKEMIHNLFGPDKHAVEVCSGHEQPRDTLLTIDMRHTVRPNITGDAQNLYEIPDNQFDRWYCDPPYNAETAKKMYGVTIPNFLLLLQEGQRIVKSDSLMFLLLGAVNYQICPKEIERIGMIFITVVPNNEIRVLNIYHKK